MTEKRSVVILGAGFGGIAAARTLKTACRSGELKVTVIDRSPFHVFTPLLYEAASGFVDHENIGTAKLLASGVSIENADTLARWGADFLEDEITGIDWSARTVQLRTGAPVRFDDLIVALGAEVNFYGIPGLKENALILKTVRDADRMRQRIHDFLHKRESGERKTLNIVIGGGGATGTELAAEISMFLRRHLMKMHLGPNDFHVTLVEASPRIIAAMEPSVSAHALERLKALGVHVYRDTAIKEAAPGRVTLAPRACKPGETIDQLLCDFKLEGSKALDADIIVWCGGIRGSSSLELLGIPLEDRGKRVAITTTLEIEGKTDAYAIGDSALLMDPTTKQPVPWLAQAALVAGQVAAVRILAKLAGTKAPEYDFPKFPVVVPLGGKHAAAVAFGFKWMGLPGWLLHEAATLRYFLTIMPPYKAVLYWWKGAMMYSRND